jgi:hypothetical protein
MTIMAHFVRPHFARPHFGKAHFDKDTLDRVESAIMLGLVGSGLAACAIGAFIYDVGRWISVW